MNCDQVFDILTRGPFPTGTPCDTGVEAHLSTCAECRRLAEALRPALELFQEAVAPEESRDLPGYWCAVATDRKQPVVSYAEEAPLVRTAPQRWSAHALSPRWSALAMWRLAAMLALGVTLGLLAGSRGSMLGGFSSFPPIGTPATTAAQPPDDNTPRLSQSQQMELAALPAACFEHQPGVAPRYTVTTHRVLATADLQKLKCCMDCHDGKSTAAPVTKPTLAKVSQSCQLCHK